MPALIAVGLLLVFAGNTEFHELLGLMIVFVSVLSLLSLAACAAAGNACVPGGDHITAALPVDSAPACAELLAPTDPPRFSGRQARGTPEFGAQGVTT